MAELWSAPRDGRAAGPDLQGAAALLPRESLRKAFARIEPGNTASLCIVDIDGLGAINAAYGYQRGDAAIATTATTLRLALRGTDLVTRWTDDAFAVLCPATNERAAVQVLEYALRRVRDETLAPGLHGAMDPVRVTFSAGVYEVRGGDNFDGALRAAELALGQAKRSGKNTVLGSSHGLLVKRRALVVEDDPVMAALVKALLAVEGLESVAVGDGARALACVSGMGIGLVVLDLLVPVMHGLDFLQNLRRIPGCAHLPVLVLSGMRTPEDIARGLDLGGDDYLAKPFAPVEFQARVRRLLHRDEPAGVGPQAGNNGKEGHHGNGNHASHAGGPG